MTSNWLCYSAGLATALLLQWLRWRHLVTAAWFFKNALTILRAVGDRN